MGKEFYELNDELEKEFYELIKKFAQFFDKEKVSLCMGSAVMLTMATKEAIFAGIEKKKYLNKISELYDELKK